MSDTNQQVKQIVLLGAGKIGQIIASFLSSTNDYTLKIVDANERNLAKIPIAKNITKSIANIKDTKGLRPFFKNTFAVINAFPFHFAKAIALIARENSVHYLDLTEDVASAQAIQALAKNTDTVFIPQCGLAPGFISIVAYDLTKNFATLEKIDRHVGALPLYPTNALKYNLTWNTEGLINEYCNPCLAIHDGKLKEVLPLENLKEFSLDGMKYEAFITSGGLGSLGETLGGKVDNLNYQTIRYPGHCEIIKILIHDLKLGERRDLLVDLLENAIPTTLQDVVLIFVTVSGLKNDKLLQESYFKKIYHKKIGDKNWGGIQITTASAICAVLDLLCEGKIPNKGFVKQEDITLDEFLKNRFGRYFA